MTNTIRRKLEKGEEASLTWDPVKGGRKAWVCFEDDKTVELGRDPDGHFFKAIANLMMMGHYYPPDAVRFYGWYKDEQRPLRRGDRILQQAPILGFHAWSMTEIFIAELTNWRCSIGYVTTALHHGRGIWRADLTWDDGTLSLRVKSTASPHSWLFWLGLPVARYLQLRARRRAIEEFQRLIG